MALLPHGTCLISTVFVCGMHKCIPFCVSCGIDTNTCKDLHTWPLLPRICQLSPQSLYSPEGFMQLHHFACSYCTLSPPVVKTKQTLETTLKTSWENKLPLKVIFPLTLDSAPCFSSKNSCAATVIRIGGCWMCYSWAIFVLTCLCMFADVCVCVCDSWARRGDTVGLAHGHRGAGLESELLCHLQQSTCPDSLVAGLQGAQHLRCNNGRGGTTWCTMSTRLRSICLSRLARAVLTRVHNEL